MGQEFREESQPSLETRDLVRVICIFFETAAHSLEVMRERTKVREE
jgi:hypothetical protein